MANYTPNEVVDILITLGECGRNYRLTACTYVERFPNRRHPNAPQISLNWKLGILKRELGVPRSTAHRWLQSVNYHPYHITLVQELSEADYVLRVQFCRWALEILDLNPNFFWEVCFSDEATFISNGSLNRHNCHYWSPQNPHWYTEVLNQHRWSVHVWVGICNGQVIGPHFFERTINGPIARRTQIGPFQDQRNGAGMPPTFSSLAAGVPIRGMKNG
ncbi:hypothetical protein TSAR_005583, partial [Trichomalopsis sarcophagae]